MKNEKVSERGKRRKNKIFKKCIKNKRERKNRCILI